MEEYGIYIIIGGRIIETRETTFEEPEAIKLAAGWRSIGFDSFCEAKGFNFVGHSSYTIYDISNFTDKLKKIGATRRTELSKQRL